MVEYHPFTIASPPTTSDTKIAFYVKRSGDWTEKLTKLVQAQIPVTNRGKDVEESKLYVTATISLPMYLEGPFGVLSVDLANAQVYKTVVLIAGGVGTTPMKALFSKLLSQKNNKGSQHKRELHLIWSVRDPALAGFILEHVITTQLLANGFLLSVAEENGKEDCCAVYSMLNSWSLVLKRSPERREEAVG